MLNHAPRIVNELRANMVRVEADFGATPIKAKIADAEQGVSSWSAELCSARVHQNRIAGGAMLALQL